MSNNLNDWRKFQAQHFPGTLGAEFFDHMVGDLLGSGVDRTVFEYVPDKTCVIKFSTRRTCFQNIHEWDLWQQHHSGTPTAVCKFLAPCVSISHSGNVLIQKRTKPIPWDRKLPKFVPVVLTDLKRENWGIYQGRIVCHDYGRHDAIWAASRARPRGNMKRAEWMGASDGKFSPMFGEAGATSLVI